MTKGRANVFTTLIFLFLVSFQCFSQKYWISSTLGNWSDASNWALASNGAGGAGAPLASETAFFTATKIGNCNLDVSPTISGISINGYTGFIDLNSHTLICSSVNANSTFATGTITNTGAAASVQVTTNGTVTFSGTAFGTTLNPEVSVSTSAGSIRLNGSVFQGPVDLTKTSASTVNDLGNGGNTFNNTVSMTNSSNNIFQTAAVNPDTFKGPLTITNNGISIIKLAEGSANNVFNGNIIVNNTNANINSGIYFGQSNGTGIVADAVSISVGSLGYNAGKLVLAGLQFGTSSSAIAQNLILPATGTAQLSLGPSSSFQSDVNFESPSVYLNGAIYNGVAAIKKTGPSSDGGNGQNTFNKNSSITNSGTGSLQMAGNDIFNGQTTLTTTSTGYIAIGNGPANTFSNFNHDILLNSTGGGKIYFGNNGAVVTLADGHKMSVGNLGFSSGDFRLVTFTQVGATSQSLNFTGTATLLMGYSTSTPSVTFSGKVNFVAPQIYLNGATFNDDVRIEKTGATVNSGYGANVFYGTTFIRNSGTGALYLANIIGDTFNSDVTFSKTGTGGLFPACGGTNTFCGNITVESSTTMTFGTGTTNPSMELIGANPQTISKTGTANPSIVNLRLNKSNNSVTLATEVDITGKGTFTSGVMYTSAANYLNFANNATMTGGSTLSYVDGPVRKTGTNPFTFPTGANGRYRPIAISAPSSFSNYFTAQFLIGDATSLLGSNLGAGLTSISDCEYWTLVRCTSCGTVSNVNVTLGWNSPDCPAYSISDITRLSVGRWSGTQWVNEGNNLSALTGNSLSGTVTSSSPVTTFGTFALGSTSTDNVLPIELLSFEANQTGKYSSEITFKTASEENNSYFEIQKNSNPNNPEFDSLGIVQGKGTTNELSVYHFIDYEFTGPSYYRLKQVDMDGTAGYSQVIFLKNSSSAKELTVSPNPFSSSVKFWVYPNNENENMVMTILNSTGQILRSYQGDVKQITSRLNADLESISPGFYIMKLSTASEDYYCRVVKN